MNYSAEYINGESENGRVADLVKRAERKHDAQFADLIELVDSSHDKDDEFVGAIFITGPSASGKTTFSMRLSRLLELSGYSAPVISIDNYYRDREEIHRLEIELGMVKSDTAEFDYEAVEAFDVPFFRDQMSQFLRGEKIYLPRYDFLEGRRLLSSESLKKKNNTIVIVEGIQAMNPAFGENLAFSKEFNVYICPFDGFEAENGRFTVTSQQLRFLRRSTRDIISRGSSVGRTMQMWNAVRAGEEKYIKPMKKYADFFFNSTLEYEILFHSSNVNRLIKGLSDKELVRFEEILDLQAISKFASCKDLSVPERSIFKEFYVG